MAGRGVRRWEEVVELLMAGATVVETCTRHLCTGFPSARKCLMMWKLSWIEKGMRV